MKLLINLPEYQNPVAQSDNEENEHTCGRVVYPILELLFVDTYIDDMVKRRKET